VGNLIYNFSFDLFWFVATASQARFGAYNRQYRCENGKKKKRFQVAVTCILALLDSLRLQDSRNALDFLQEPIVHLQTQKRSPGGCWIVNCQFPDFSEIAFSVGYLHK
jgi:hypothetical protein